MLAKFMKTFIIPTSITEHLAKKILVKTEIFEIIFPDLSKDGGRYFPDREVYMKILKANQLRGKRVIILHSGAPRPNEGLIELELILQILRDNKIQPEVFFAYFPYGMQDKVFEKGETNVAENLIEKLVNYYRVKTIYVIDPHFGGRKWMKKYPITNISAIPILMKEAKKDFGKDILFLATDEGGKRRFKVNGFNKIRKNSHTVELTLSKKLEKIIKGKVIGIVDDILKTGGTLIKASEKCKKLKSRKVLGLVTHGVLKEGIKKVRKNFEKLYLTNSINQPEIPQIDITKLILKNLQSDK
ncbi:MAG: hypothetical protein COU43_01050 [Candidatus Nealsonbacteria bacterium CG10_big_fil_rev_8_21_14_0_10_37_25]|uniref:Uncharacterized protein n=1 Tax=Candidatus Nealsonbacteria bacterium CG10_big_fil_rev_8_21_14_0_10_37_25 TaxID=1974711 RepID=A0A2H0TL76_9BACT|nr:MAG: hypothetical protein COU43_01050 [Candidatus Nealsonbacteria bacterium CG10_big_fil_rev_8_21_14_0_10_37_25]